MQARVWVVITVKESSNMKYEIFPLRPGSGTLFSSSESRTSIFSLQVWGDRTMTSTAGPSYTPAPKPKSRRSGRRCRRRSNTSDTDSQSLSTLGYFQTLPLEIFQMVLNYLPGENTIRTVLIPVSENHHRSFPFRKCRYYLKRLTFS